MPRRLRRLRGAAATIVAAILVGWLAAARAQAAPRAQEIVVTFSVGPEGCADREGRFVVSMWIYNVLAQPVAIPTLVEQPGTTPVSPELVGRRLSRLALPCGRYAAHWDGRHSATGRRLAPGVYLYDLIVDGKRVTRRVRLP